MALTWPRAAEAQDDSIPGLDRLTRTVRKVTTYVSRLSDRVAALARPADPQVVVGMRRDISGVRSSLERLLEVQSGLFQQIDDYVRFVRSPGVAPSELAARWDGLHVQFADVFSRVDAISDRIRETRYLDDATDAEFVADLQSLLNARMGILAQLQLIPPPRTEDELAALGRLTDAYRSLHTQLGEAVREMERTERRFV